MRITLLANPDNLHVQRWIEFLAGRGHELTLITDPFARHRPSQCRTLVVRWNVFTKILAFRLTPRPFGNDLWKHLHYRPLIKASRPEVVHGFEGFNYGLATAYGGPYPKVLTVWGKDVHQDADATRLGGWIVTHALRGVDCITANDDSMPQYLERRFGIDPARVRAFSWGVDLSVFRPGLREEAERWRQALEIPAGASVLLSPRNFIPHWGSELLLEALPEIVRERPGAVFMILRGGAGAAEAFQTARARCEAAGVGRAVRFIDRVLTAQEMAGLFNLAAAFISIPATDLLAQTVLEGMACGCLPILSDRPAYRKHARPGENVLMLPEYSASGLARMALEALDNGALRERAGEENPRLMARDEDWRINALQMEEAYGAALEFWRRRR